MDTTKTTTHIGLCAGYGGIELGLKRVLPALRTVAFCEIEAFACANLVAKMEAGLMDTAPIWTDLKTFPWAAFRDRVDILSGGYPCQPFSSAGKRLGADDPRHLWPYIASGIRLLRPRLCFFENVEGHISLGLSTVISDLEEMGYRVAWGIFSAAQVGAPHQRKRVFVMAVADSFGGATGLSEQVARHEWQPGITNNGCFEIWPSRPGEPQHAWEPPRVVGNAEMLNGARQAGGQREASSRRTGTARDDGQTKPPLGGDTHGTTSGLDYAELCISCDNRTDELRLLGNGVVPATAAKAFVTLFNELGR